MRSWLVLFGLAACRHAGETGAAPVAPLDDPGPAPQPGVMPAAEIPAFTPGAPASKPTGAAIAVTFVPPKAGSRRVRTQTLVAIYDNTFEIEGRHEERHQITQDLFKLVEEVDQVDAGRVTAMRADVIDAREVVTVGGQQNPEELLQGTYVVDVGAGLREHGRMTAHAVGGRGVGSREEEELGALFALDAGNESPLVRVLRMHPLRVGESIVLGDAEKQAFVGGPAAPQPLSLSMIELVAGKATYQLDLTLELTEGSTKIVRVTQQRETLSPTNGRVLALVVDEHQTETSPTSTSDQRSHVSVTFEPTSR